MTNWNGINGKLPNIDWLKLLPIGVYNILLSNDNGGNVRKCDEKRKIANEIKENA